MVFFQGQFEAWVILDSDEPDGARREEYAVEVDEQTKLVTCWIASEIGKTFQVCWKAPSASFPCNGDLYLDGNWAGCKVRPPHCDATTLSVHRAYSTSSTTERPYMFSSLEVTDDDAYLSTDSSRIGEIRLKINRAKLGETKCRPQSKPPATDQKVHERTKKAVVHRVGFGEEKVISGTGSRWSLQRMERLANFVFKYRNLDMLQANGIAQPSADPQPQVAEPPRNGTKRKSRPIKQEACQDSEGDGDEDEDEEKALLAKLAEVRARRGQKDQNRPLKKVKTEDTSVKTNFTVLPGGIIDLT